MSVFGDLMCFYLHYLVGCGENVLYPSELHVCTNKNKHIDQSINRERSKQTKT